MRIRSLALVCLIAGGLLPSRAHAAGSLDDATILAIFDQANTADIVTGRLGAKYGASEDVRALGRMVATDHVAVQQMGRDLAKKLALFPSPPDDDAIDVRVEAIAKNDGKVELAMSRGQSPGHGRSR